MALLQTHTLVIGASCSGLALAASLKRCKIEHVVIEKHDCVAMPWRQHYNRLHLHTPKRHSSLPYKSFRRDIPIYPSRQQLIDYLEEYQSFFDIQPLFDTQALDAHYEGNYWITHTNRDVFRSQKLVIATGAFSTPTPILIEGMQHFTGEIIHSSQYRDANHYRNKQVLVIGFGNSACEIAIDLVEQQAYPFMSVRSAVNVIPRDVLGIPIVELSLLMRRLSPAFADRLSAPLIQLIVGDLSSIGLKKLEMGPLEQIQNGCAPVLDIGTIRLIRQQHIQILPGISHIEGNTVHFTNGAALPFDAIIACIGYQTGLTDWLHVPHQRFDDLHNPIDKQPFFGKDGLYFCGFWISPTGQLREIALDAQKIAAHIAANK